MPGSLQAYELNFAQIRTKVPFVARTGKRGHDKQRGIYKNRYFRGNGSDL